MKILRLLLLLCLALPAVADIGDITGSATLTATCSNANITCDTAGTTVFNPGSPFNVQGPQTIEVTTQGYGLVTVTASGTYSGSTLNFEFSDDGGTTWYSEQCTRTDANIQEASEAVATNAFRAWDCGVGAATKFRVRQSAISSGGPLIKLTLTQGLVEPAPTVSLSNTVGQSDPCQNPGVLKSSTKIQVSATTAVALVALSAGKSIYVCGWEATIQGSATTVGTVQLEYGTQVTNPCDTGTVTLTGVLAGNITASVPTLVGRSGPGTIYSTTASQQLCAISTGTTISVQGDLTYVQQ